MIKLCTRDEAKRMLKIDTVDEDELIDALIAASSELIVLYLKGRAASVIGINDSGIIVDVTAIPNRVRIATAMLVGYLKNNPDSDDGKAFEMGYLPKPVMALLYSSRDPALA